jgi:thymidylate kinase
MKKGKFIVLYGINNLGKTTQAKLLVKMLKKNGKKAEYVKYPIYNLEPAGKLINEYLRKDNPYNFSPREFELIHFIDRISYETTLKDKLNKGINVIAEDYFGTALAWGIGAGVDKKLLEYLYSFVYKEDLAILFDGKRFIDSVEINHKHENDEKLIGKVKKAHLEIGEKYSWQKINANLPIEEIQKNIWEKVKRIIK